MKRIKRALAILSIITLLAGCKAGDCGCPGKTFSIDLPSVEDVLPR